MIALCGWARTVGPMDTQRGEKAAGERWLMAVDAADGAVCPWGETVEAVRSGRRRAEDFLVQTTDHQPHNPRVPYDLSG